MLLLALYTRCLLSRRRCSAQVSGQAPSDGPTAVYCAAHGATSSADNTCCIAVVSYITAGSTSLGSSVCAACQSVNVCPTSNRNWPHINTGMSHCVPGGSLERDYGGDLVTWCKTTCESGCIAVICVSTIVGAIAIAACVACCIRRNRQRRDFMMQQAPPYFGGAGMQMQGMPYGGQPGYGPGPYAQHGGYPPPPGAYPGSSSFPIYVATPLEGPAPDYRALHNQTAGLEAQNAALQAQVAESRRVADAAQAQAAAALAATQALAAQRQRRGSVMEDLQAIQAQSRKPN